MGAPAAFAAFFAAWACSLPRKYCGVLQRLKVGGQDFPTRAVQTLIFGSWQAPEAPRQLAHWAAIASTSTINAIAVTKSFRITVDLTRPP